MEAGITVCVYVSSFYWIH